MRVTTITRVLPTPDDRAAGLFVARRLEAMAARCELTVLQPVPYFPVVRSLPGWAKAPTVPNSRLAAQPVPMFYVPRILKSLDSYWLRRACQARLAALRDSNRLDILDAHFGYPDGVAVTELAGRLGVPAVVTFRGVEQDYLEQSAIARQLAAMLKAVAGCICVSHSLRDVAIQAGADPSRVAVIHNAIDRQMFRPGGRAAARATLGLNVADRWLISVGNLLSVKRHDVLLRAFAEVRAVHPTLKLAIAGGVTHEPETGPALAALARDLGVADNVRFLGRVPPDQIVTWLRAADLFGLASRREGCCNAILESLATGLPVVATDVGDNRFFIRPGENGALVPANDVSALAAGIRDTLSRADWDRDRISAGLDVGQWDSVAEKVTDYFEQCRARFRDESRHGESPTQQVRS
ncbi:MAG: glycosyltransferase [Pseudomonadota bacterium]